MHASAEAGPKTTGACTLSDQVDPSILQGATSYLAAWLSDASHSFEFVYVIQADGDTPIKIGKAVDVPKRLAQLQTGNPRPLQLLAVMPGGYGLTVMPCRTSSRLGSSPLKGRRARP